jgi:multiple sugar transport system ATP-binding protein
MARILLKNVTKIFDEKVTAVSDFCLDVADGQFMVIVGPSGCGKTTTLRLIAGLEKATSGNIYIADNLVNDVPPKDRDVAMVFQNYVLYPHMTAFQNMAFALKMHKFPRKQIKKLVQEAADLLDIKELLGRKPHALSGGQRQRIALGKAIVRNPKAFLFDEPLSNLDAGMRLTMRAEIKALHQKLKTTTLYVTHDQAEAMTLGERICVMQDGVIQQVAEPLEVYEKPVNRFVAGFFGTPPMNFLAGRLNFENDSAYFEMARDKILLPQYFKTQLENCRNKEIIIGIRPENISPYPFPGRKNNEISAKVKLIEPVGNRTDIYLNSTDGQRLIISSTPHTQFKLNDAVTIHIDVEKILMFEPGPAGKTITLNSQEADI